MHIKENYARGGIFGGSKNLRRFAPRPYRGRATGGYVAPPSLRPNLLPQTSHIPGTLSEMPSITLKRFKNKNEIK